tara:strand:+ start:5634 stop:5807 length:174 start_codon:yes stop_codon:yes gene_type:complete
VAVPKKKRSKKYYFNSLSVKIEKLSQKKSPLKSLIVLSGDLENLKTSYPLPLLPILL